MISIHDEVNYIGKDLDVKNPAEVVDVTGDNEVELYDIEDKAGKVYRVGADEIELVVKTEVPAEDAQSGYTPKFKVGDKVVCVSKDNGFPDSLLNVIGEIERVSPTDYLIKYEDCSYYAMEYQLRHAEDTQTTQVIKFKKFTVGDKVKSESFGSGVVDLMVYDYDERPYYVKFKGTYLWMREDDLSFDTDQTFETHPPTDTQTTYTPPCKTRALDPKPTEPHVTFALRNAQFTATGTGLTVTINNESVTLSKSEANTLATLVREFVV